MNIAGLTKTTLLDFPTRVAATIFTSGCNFRCPFCHNKGLVLPSGLVTPSDAAVLLSEVEVFAFLRKRLGVLSGVCISGGEPTLQPDLLSFAKQIKDLGYALKLDTNGYRPQVLKELYENNLLDYVAMDIKSSLIDYPTITCLPSFSPQNIEESISIIQNSGIPYEFRSTIVKEFHSMEVLTHMRALLSEKDSYYLQSYQDSEQVIQPGFHAYSEKEMKRIAEFFKEKITNTYLRGI